ncbi:MAG: ACP S-malonyltransferase, partial [Candidatus Ratteibacteria bacterium]|nr:ACP S-malonyltransferase [Candidatus Ratteibacteria bacterium]
MQIPQNCLSKKIKEQLFFWQGDNVENLVEKLENSESFLAANDGAELSEIVYLLYSETPKNKSASYNLAIVAESLEDLQNKIASAKISLKGNPKFIRDSKGIYFSSSPLARNGKIAFLFSGQGSQRPNMLRDLRVIFHQFGESVQKADTVLKSRLPKLLSEYIYPPVASDPEQEKQYMKELTQTNVAQPALGAVEVGLFKIMRSFGINPEMLAGHSLGEYVALYAAGVMEEKTLYELLEYRGSAIITSGRKGGLGTMLAVGVGADEIKNILNDISGVYIANLNSPKQTILSGDEKGLESAGAELKG